MFEQYTDHILLNELTMEEFRARVVEHLSAPSGPVRLTGSPAMLMVNAIIGSAGDAGLTPVPVITNAVLLGEEVYVAGRIAAADLPVVFIIAVDPLKGSGIEVKHPHNVALEPALRDLASREDVHVTFVVYPD